MGQLLTITTTDYEAVRISGGGKFVPSTLIEAERRRALRHSALTAQQAKVENQSFTREINSSYQRVYASQDLKKELGELQQPLHPDIPTLFGPPGTVPSTAELLHEKAVKEGRFIQTLPATDSALERNQALQKESSSSYYQERGAMEMRVQRGELSFLPPLSMTIVTQKPEVNIKYTGDFNYFPEPSDSGSHVNLDT